MSKPDPDRVADLESALAHQQHKYDGLNEVVIEQQKIIDALAHRVTKMESLLNNLQNQLPADDLADEKPPHY